jgi:polyhydroxybutyrate depolymerase
MKRTCLLLILLLLASQAGRAVADDKPRLGSGTHDFTLKAAGHEWHYHVHIPPKYDAAKPMPLVLILHGAGGNGIGYLTRAGWAKKADAAGFIAVAPDGLPMRPGQEANFLNNPHLWQSGQLAATSPRGKIDDVTFFKALLDDVGRRVNVDTDRVYATGHSNGGGMTFRLGAELPERFAALAVVASLPWIKDPTPSRPLPTLFIIGTEDPLVPLKGGESTTPWGKRTTLPVAEGLAKWAKALGCPEEPKTVRDKDGVKVVEYGPGKDDVKLTAYYITGQGHGWPGGQELLPARLIGPRSDKVNAADLIWEFFEHHPRSPKQK